MIRKVLALILLAWLIWWLWPDGGRCDRHFSLMTFNVNTFHQGTGERNLQLVESILQMQRPQLVCLQEVNLDFLQPSPEDWAQRMGFKYSLWVRQYRQKSRVGLGLLSRFPIQEHEVILLSEQPDPRYAQRALVKAGEQLLQVVNLHLSNRDFRHNELSEQSLLREIFHDNLRTLQLDHLLNALDTTRKEPLIIAGDFNTFPGSKAWRKMRRRYSDAVSWRDILTPTYKLEYNARIDYIFHNQQVLVQDYSVLDRVASDHNPVIGHFCLKQSQ